MKAARKKSLGKTTKKGSKGVGRNAGKRGNAAGQETANEKKFSRVAQTDVPAYPLEKALVISQTIADRFERKPVSPLKLAAAMKVQPNSPSFRMLTGASIAYGLTKGGWNAKQIEIAPTGMRIVHTTKEGDDLLAKREAILKPRVFAAFLTQYDSRAVPKREIALNILKDMGVPDDRAEGAFDLMIESAKSVGYITSINSRDYIDLEGATPPDASDQSSDEDEPASDSDGLDGSGQKDGTDDSTMKTTTAARPETRLVATQAQLRVFVTHGKNTQYVETIKS